MTVGPSPVVLALLAGRDRADTIWLRKCTRVAFINAGREIIGFTAPSASTPRCMQSTGTPGLSLELPARGAASAWSRVLLRDPGALLLHAAGARQAGAGRTAPDPPLGRSSSMLLTLVAARGDGGGAAVALAGWAGSRWRCVLAVLGTADQADPGRGDRRRGPEQDAPDGVGDREQRQPARDRSTRSSGWPTGCSTGVTSGSTGWNGTDVDAGVPRRARAPRPRSGDPEELVRRSGGRSSPRRARSGARRASRPAGQRRPSPRCGASWCYPIRFGDDLLGTVEVDHPKRHAYGHEGPARRWAPSPPRSPRRSTSPSCAVRW